MLPGAARPAAPTFQHIREMVLTFRADRLSTMPATWYSLINAPEDPRAPRRAIPSNRERSGASPVFNTHADRALMQRFQASGHRNIRTLLEGHEVEVPQHSNKPVCLVWALKGECSDQCRRKGQHVRYGRPTNQAIHRMLDECGVNSPQA